MKSIKVCFENAIKLIKSDTDLHLLGIFKLLDYIETDPKPVPEIPTNLRFDVPPLKIQQKPNDYKTNINDSTKNKQIPKTPNQQNIDENNQKQTNQTQSLQL